VIKGRDQAKDVEQLRFQPDRSRRTLRAGGSGLELMED